MLLGLSATIAGMEERVQITLWSQEGLDFLRRLPAFERDSPTHETLNEVINALDADLFQGCFAQRVEDLREEGPETWTCSSPWR